MPPAAIPFDAARLDRLMDEAGIDVLIATSKHNVQYLLGGHRAFFFDYMDAMGLSRYLPVLVYAKGAPDKAAYFGHRLESFQRENKPFWTPVQQTNSSGSVDTMQKAIEHIRKPASRRAASAPRLSFLPVDAGKALRSAFADSEIDDALFVLERMRAIKTPEELKKLQDRLRGGDRVDAGGDRQARPGRDQGGGHRGAAPRGDQPRAHLRVLPDHGRHEPQPRAVRAGLGQGRHPVARLRRQLSRLYRRPLPHGDPGRAGRRARGHAGRDRGDPARRDEADQGRRHGQRDLRGGRSACSRKSKHHNNTHFLAHGMGLVSHEAPRLTTTGPVPYDDYDAHRPLEAGMVISVETTLAHPKRGFIKLEDTVVVTDKGFEIYGEGARGWNRAGTAARS